MLVDKINIVCALLLLGMFVYHLMSATHSIQRTFGSAIYLALTFVCLYNAYKIRRCGLDYKFRVPIAVNAIGGVFAIAYWFLLIYFVGICKNDAKVECSSRFGLISSMSITLMTIALLFYNAHRQRRCLYRRY